MGVTEAVTVSTASSVVQPVHSRPALCFMRYSWHAQLSACNAYLWKYLSGDLCLYWMQLCLQFCPGDIDLAMLPKHILPFQAFNLFWSTWKAQESGLPYIALVSKLIPLVTLYSPHLALQMHLPPFNALFCAWRLTSTYHYMRDPFALLASTKVEFNQWVALAGNRGYEETEDSVSLSSRSRFASGWVPLPQHHSSGSSLIYSSLRILVATPSFSALAMAVNFYITKVVVQLIHKYLNIWFWR